MFFLTAIEALMAFCLNYHILKYILGVNLKSKIPFIFICITFGIYLSLSCITSNEVVFDLMVFIINIVICLYLKILFQKISIWLILRIHIFIISVNVIIASIIVFLSNNVLFTDNEIKVISFAVNLIFTVLAILICKIKAYYIRKIFYNTSRMIKHTVFISLLASAILLSFISGAPYFNNVVAWNISIRIVAVLFIIIIGMLFPVLITTSMSKSFYLKRSEVFEQQTKTQADYYSNLAKSNYELRRFRHDFNNVCIGVSRLIDENKLDEALKMINTYSKNLSDNLPENKFQTGSEIANALLTDKQKKADAFNTKIIFQGAIPNDLISPLDLCIILGNALDNAIEACEYINSQETKEINFAFTCSGGLAFITITNPVKDNIKIRNNTISTTKSDKANHGFGIYSIKRAIEKYNGTLDLLCNNNVFSISITLELQIKL